MDKIILVIGLVLILISGILLVYAFSIKTKKQSEISSGKRQIEENLYTLQSLLKTQKEIEDKIKLQEEEYQSNLVKNKERLETELDLYKTTTSYVAKQYNETLEQAYSKAEQDFDNKIIQLDNEKQQTEQSINKLKDALSAGVQAQLREQEKKDKIDFYRIVVSDNDIADIKLLSDLKKSFHQPIIISKLIWTTYCQKKVTEMCNRILGTGNICGIYKITNLNTQQCYIGQSVNIGA